jgi:hypothetical protein
VAILGFGLMLLAYFSRPRLDPTAPWAYGVIVIGPESSAEQLPPGPTILARLRLLPGNERTEGLLRSILIGQATPAQSSRQQAQLRPKLICLPLAEEGISAETLQAGRLPIAGRDEILAGAQASPKDRLSVAGRTLEVVGVLKPDIVLFVDCYLVPPSATTSALFADGDPAVQPATLVRLSPESFRDRQVRERLEAAYPSARYARVMGLARLDRRAFYLYLTGMAGLLLGGAGTWIGLFRWLAGCVRRPFLSAPLEEMRRRPSLVWAVHLAYFGLVVLAAVLAFEAGRGQWPGGTSSGDGSLPRPCRPDFGDARTSSPIPRVLENLRPRHTSGSLGNFQ